MNLGSLKTSLTSSEKFWIQKWVSSCLILLPEFIVYQDNEQGNLPNRELSVFILGMILLFIFMLIYFISGNRKLTITFFSPLEKALI